MNQDRDNLNPESLLAHDDFIRALARSLLFDEHHVDEVVQKIWLIAIEKSPEEVVNLRAWLHAVVRNQSAQLLRRQYRVKRREQVAAKPEATASTDEIVERENTRAEIVQSVLSLEEPHRSAILFRFYDGLPPRVIAKRLDISIDTVRSRIRRGLELLRLKLDQKHGNDRQAWCLGLIPFAAMSVKTAGSFSALSGGAWIVNLKMKGLVAALLVVVGLGIAWKFSREDGGRTETAKLPVQSIPSKKPVKETDAKPVAQDTTSADSNTAFLRNAITRPYVWGIITDSATQKPLSGIKVIFLGTKEASLPQIDVLGKSLIRRECTTDAHGEYRFAASDADFFCILSPSQKGFLPNISAACFSGERAIQLSRVPNMLNALQPLAAAIGSPQFQFIELKSNESREISFSLDKGVKVFGKVFSANNHPISGARVIGLPPIAISYFPEISGQWDAAVLFSLLQKKIGFIWGDAISGEDGSFEIEGAPRSYGLIAGARGFIPGQTLVEASSVASIQVNLVLEPSMDSFVIQGRVRDEESRPVQKAVIYLVDAHSSFDPSSLQELSDSLKAFGVPFTESNDEGDFSLFLESGKDAQLFVDISKLAQEPVRLVCITPDQRLGMSEKKAVSSLAQETTQLLAYSSRRMSGTLLDAETSLPISQASVMFYESSIVADYFSFRRRDVVTTDSEGKFITPPLSPVTAQSLFFNAAGYLSSSLKFKDIQDADNRFQFFLTKEKNTLCGTVKFPDGRPVPDRRLVVFPSGILFFTRSFEVSVFQKDPREQISLNDQRTRLFSFPATYNAETGQFSCAIPNDWSQGRVWVGLSFPSGGDMLVREVSASAQDVNFVLDEQQLQSSAVTVSALIQNIKSKNNDPLAPRFDFQFARPGESEWQSNFVSKRRQSDKGLELETILPGFGEYDLRFSATNFGASVFERVKIDSHNLVLPVTLPEEGKIQLKVNTYSAFRVRVFDAWGREIANDQYTSGPRTLNYRQLGEGRHTVVLSELTHLLQVPKEWARQDVQCVAGQVTKISLP